MSGLRRVGMLRKGMLVDMDGRQAVVVGFPTRNTVSLRVEGDAEMVKVNVSRFTKQELQGLKGDGLAWS